MSPTEIEELKRRLREQLAISPGLIFWQGGMSTDAAGARLTPEYGISSSPYLPIQRLEPVY
jgi:hypothetical protein